MPLSLAQSSLLDLTLFDGYLSTNMLFWSIGMVEQLVQYIYIDIIYKSIKDINRLAIRVLFAYACMRFAVCIRLSMNMQAQLVNSETAGNRLHDKAINKQQLMQQWLGFEVWNSWGWFSLKRLDVVLTGFQKFVFSFANFEGIWRRCYSRKAIWHTERSWVAWGRGTSSFFIGSSHCRVSCDSKMATWNTWGRSEKRARWDGPTWSDHVSDHFFEIHVHNHWPKILKDWKIPPKLDPNLPGPDHSHGPNMAKLETLGPFEAEVKEANEKAARTVKRASPLVWLGDVKLAW